MKRPVRPVGAPASRYREGLTAASCRNVRRMVVEVNGGDEGCGEAERCCDANNLERASRSWHRASLSNGQLYST